MVAAVSVAGTTRGPFRILHLRFVQGLLLQGLSNDAVHVSLDRHDLDDLDDAQLDRLRADLARPKNFSLKKRKHRPSLDFLDALGVTELIHPTADADQALLLLRTPRARELVEVGLIVQVPVAALIEQLRRERVVVTPMALELFERWFWAVTAFDRADLRSILELRAIRRALRGAVDDDERRVALRAARFDARVLAVSVPCAPESWYLALAAIGHRPVAVPVDKVLEQLRFHAALRVAESVMRGAPGDENRGLAFMGILRGVLEVEQRVVPPEAALLKGLGSFRLVTDPTPIPHIDQLSGGNHTVDVPVRVEPDADDS